MMNNVIAIFKRFLKNKNIVTIIGVIIILVLLYFGYSSQINNAVDPVSVVVAAETIQPRTKITDEMVKEIEVPNISVSDGVYRNRYDVIDKYTNVNTMVPEGSMFYKQSVIKEEDLPDAAFVKVKKGEVVYSFPVDMESTYGNSIFPGSFVDIYMKVGDGDDEKVKVGKLLKNVEVLALKDSSGKAVFENTSEERQPSMMIFGLSEKNYSILKKASYLSGVELYLVPSSTATKNSKTEVSTQQLVDYINAHSEDIPTDDSAGGTAIDELVPVVSVTKSNNKYTAVITYPEGCGSTYTCTYSKNGVAAKKVSKKTVQSVVYDKVGTLIATVTEKDGTVHKYESNIPIESASTATNGQVG